MRNETYGGLAGQSRRVRYRNRADRLYTQQLIEEYLEPEDETDREIPIKGRSDFLPTVAGGVVETTSESGTQLELPLAVRTNEPRKEVAAVLPRVEQPAKPEDGKSRDFLRATRKTADTERWASQDITAFSSTRGRGDFDIGKFLYGCLIGGGAAAVVLVVLQIVI